MEKEILDFNQTPSGNRIQISFFGRRNAGKSSVVNALTGQSLSIVSAEKGTTTDPVRKTMELLPLGPVVITDTPGIDDFGLVGEQRIEKAYQVLRRTDIAVLVIDGLVGPQKEDFTLIDLFTKGNIPFLTAFNKVDLGEATWINNQNTYEFPHLSVSALTGQGVNQLKEMLGKLAKSMVMTEKKLVGDLVHSGDVILLVTPIDQSAPKGRIILPQVQMIRDILDAHGCTITVQLAELETVLRCLKEPPALIITDSQVFKQVKAIIPETIQLTSFSILFARFKGILNTALNGAYSISLLKDGDAVLISEGCTHHRQCEDIGTIKLPDWIKKFSGKKLNFSFSSGGEFPKDLGKYALIVHCGGCMLNEKEMMYRMGCAEDQGIPFTNYGILIAHINGILERSVEVFNE